MKRTTYFLCCGLAWACGAAPEDDAIEYGDLEQPLLMNQTNGGALRVPGVVDGPGSLAPNQFFVQCSLVSSVDCTMPTTKDIHIILDPVTDSSWLRSLVNGVSVNINADVNASAWAGTSWTVTVEPVNYNPGGLSLAKRLWIVDDCSAGNPNLPTTDIRRFYSIYRWGNWSQLGEPTSLTPNFYTVDGETELKVNSCAIGNLVGGFNTDPFKRVYKHALSQGMRVAKFGQGAIGCGSPTLATCSTVDSSVNKLSAASWQNCLAKTLSVTNSPGQAKVTSAFQCPTPPAGQ